MIDQHYTYLLVNFGAVVVPFLFTFHSKIKFYKKWKEAAIAIALPMILFLPWDMYFTRLGVWGFNPDYTLGVRIVNLPLEEILFFICIPYCCLFTYHSLTTLLFNQQKYKPLKVFTYTLSAVIIFIALIFYDKYYTFSSFFLLGLCLVWSANYFADKMVVFFLSYLILLVGFFAVNGILTGTGLEKPVVWYNNNENMGLRTLTIPVEDFFYGMLLILLNIILFEKFSEKEHVAKEK